MTKLLSRISLFTQLIASGLIATSIASIGGAIGCFVVWSLGTPSSASMVLLAVVTCFLVAASVSLVSAVHVSRRVAKLLTQIRRLAQGDTDVQVEAADVRNEFGEMASVLLRFRDAALDKNRIEAEASEQGRKLEEERRKKEEADRYYIEAHEVFMKSFTQALEKLLAGDLNCCAWTWPTSPNTRKSVTTPT